MEAWNGWFHVNGNTYGTWLPGDSRGWRDKRHRTHIEGDYKNPPPKGSGLRLYCRSRSSLKHPPVYLHPSQRKIAGQALVETFLREEIELLALSVDSAHYHILAKFGDKQVRRRVGQAKLHAYHLLRAKGQVKKVWQRLCHVKPIADRAHQLRVFGYICDHKNQGAWLWTFRDGLYWLDHPDE